VSLKAPENFTHEEYEAIVKEFARIIPFDEGSQKRLASKIAKLDDVTNISSELLEVVSKTYESREVALGESMMRELEKYVVLSTIDEKWMDHLDGIEDLREGIWLRGDKNTVLAEYKKEAFLMFESLISTVEGTIAARIFRVQPMMQRSTMPTRVQLQAPSEATPSLGQAVEVERRQVTAPNPRLSSKGSASDLAAALGKMGSSGMSSGTSSSSIGAGLSGSKSNDKYARVGRNDICPCGSGLKYKKCGLIKAKEHKE